MNAKTIQFKKILAPVVFCLLVAGSVAFGDFTSHLIDVNKSGEYSADNITNGRDYKLEQSKETWDRGADAAMTAGISMITSGVAMVNSGFLPTVIAGYTLIGYGTQELKQYSQSKGQAVDQNAGQLKLQLDADQTSSQLANSATTTSPGSSSNAAGLLNEALANSPLATYLQSQGLNSTDVLTQLTTGNISSPTDIAALLGDTREFSDQVQAQGAEIASAEVGKVTGAPLSEALEFKEGGDAKTVSVTATNSGSAVGVMNSDSSSSSKLSSEVNPKGVASRKPASAENPSLTVKDPEHASVEGFLNSLGLNVFNKQDEASKKRAAMVRADLESLGIQAPKPKQTIFQLANRGYRSFGKWRREAKVVQLSGH